MEKINRIIIKLREGFVQKAFKELVWIYRTLANYKRDIALYTGLIILSMIISMSFTFVAKDVVDNLVSYNWNGVIKVSLYYIGAGLVNVGMAMISQRIAAKVKTRIRTELSNNTYNKILHADWETVIRHHSGDLMTRMQEDIATISDSTVGWIPTVASMCIQIFAAFIFIVYYDYSMILVVLLVAPIVLLGSRIFLGKMYASNRKQRDISSKVMSLYKESFQNLQSIKGFGLIDCFVSKMKRQQNERQEIDMEVNKYSIASWSVMYISGQLAALICLSWALFRVYQGKFSLGTMTFLISMASIIASAFKSFIQQIPLAINTISSSERIRAIVTLPEEKKENEQAYQKMLEEAKKTGVSVEISNMNFSYLNGKQVFNDVSCIINKGETIAFVGPSGEGKTTMLRILLGIVRAINQPVLKTDHMALPVAPASRQFMSYVPQGNTMMNGTIAENLRMFRPEATDEEIITALKEACAYEFVEKLPDGIYHKIGESGIGFSEGQNQRLAIARALMCQTPILLLDEATSSLDVATERKVLINLRKGQRKRICILTTHRPTVLAICDRVYRITSHNVQEINQDDVEQMMNEF